MKILPFLLLNVLTAAGAIVVYDQMQDDPVPHDTALGDVDTSALERRLDKLEARRPQLETRGVDGGVLERLVALESAARIPAPSADESEGPVLDGEARPSLKSDEPFAAGSEWEPTAQDVVWYRRLRRAVERDDRIKKNAERVARALEKLALNLNEKQHTGITAAFTDFQPRIRQIWDQVKVEAQATIAAGGTVDRREIVTSTTALIQQEFAATITDVVPQADAEAVAEALMAKGR